MISVCLSNLQNKNIVYLIIYQILKNRETIPRKFLPLNLLHVYKFKQWKKQ